MTNYEKSLKNLITIYKKDPDIIFLSYLYGSYLTMGYDVNQVDKFWTEFVKGEKEVSLATNAKHTRTKVMLSKKLDDNIIEFIKNNVKVGATQVMMMSAFNKTQGNLKNQYIMLLKNAAKDEHLFEHVFEGTQQLKTANNPKISTVGQLLEDSIASYTGTKTDLETINTFDGNEYSQLMNGVEPIREGKYIVNSTKNFPQGTVSANSIEEAREKVEDKYVTVRVNQHGQIVKAREEQPVFERSNNK